MSTRFPLAVLALLMVSPNYGAAPGEQISLDASTGNYLVTYCGTGPVGAKQTCDLKSAIFVPATKTSPRTKVQLELGSRWVVAYNYQVFNNKESKQPIVSFAIGDVVDLVPPFASGTNYAPATRTANSLVDLAASALRTPSGWEPFVSDTLNGTAAIRVAWAYSDLSSVRNGLSPGFSQGGFAVISKALPGITAAEFAGNSGEPLAFEDEGPSGDIATQLNQLTLADFVVRDTAGPKVKVPDPYDAAELIRRISAEMNRWVTLNEIDGVVAQQVDSSLQAMASTASHEDWASVRKEIRALEKFINGLRGDDEGSEQDHDNSSMDWASRAPISRLAARILRFNLQYVAQRLERDDRDP